MIMKLSIDSSLTPLGDIDLDTYLDDLINLYHEDDSEILEWNTDANLAGKPAYKLVVSGNTADERGTYKEVLVGTVVNDKVYYVLYSAKPKEYDNFLPFAENMIDSFQITK